jgi:exosortase/archaeosortase family protein
MAISRERLYAFVFVLLALNALTTFAEVAAQASGWLLAALNLFDVSAIVWLALAAATALQLNSPDPTATRCLDWVLLGLALVAALLPIPVLSSAMLTAVAMWAWLSGGPGSSLRRAAAIVLTVTAFLLWGRIALAWGAGPLLRADAAFVALLAGVESTGNSVNFVGGTDFLIAPGCSSLHGISLALILWTTVIQYFALPLSRRAWVTLVAALIGSVLVNGLRLAIIAWNPSDFDYWHAGTGSVLFGWIALIVLVAVVYRGIGYDRRLA